MSEPGLVDITGRLRSPAATPGHWAGCAPPNKGQRYPADPPTVEEIILVMRQAGPGPYADRTRGLIAILWRRAADQRSAHSYRDRFGLEDRVGAGSLRQGREAQVVGMDDWTWEHLARWTDHRIQLPVGPLFCILAGPTRGRGWSATAVRGEFRRLAAQAGARRRFAHTSSGTLMRSRWRMKGIRCRLSRGSSGMPTLGSRRSTCKESIHARSSTRSTTAARR
jgi:hypothetical protein